MKMQDVPTRTKILSDRFATVKISVFSVMKCNFNDERLLDTLEIPISELSLGELLWLDPFLGRGEADALIAVSEVGYDSFTVSEKRGDEIKSAQVCPPCSYTLTLDDNEYSFLASHVSLITSKQRRPL